MPSLSSKIFRASIFCVLGTGLIITILAYTTRIFEEPDGSPTLSTPPELGIFEISSVDPYVLKAAEFLRNSYHAQQQSKCPSISDTYNQPGTVQYAKKATGANGTNLYIFEVSFGTKSVFARVRHISNITLKDRGTAEYETVSSAPSPCEGNVTDQLAVSSLGMSTMLQSSSFNIQNLMSIFFRCRKNQCAEPFLDSGPLHAISRSDGERYRNQLRSDLNGTKAGQRTRSHDSAFQHRPGRFDGPRHFVC